MFFPVTRRKNETLKIFFIGKNAKTGNELHNEKLTLLRSLLSPEEDTEKKMTDEEEEQTPLPYATLIAVSDDAKNILHVDQTTKECEKYGAKKCPLIGPNVDVRFSNCVIGRILMAKDNETRAKTQVADLALDLPSGKFLFLWLFAIIARACLCLCLHARASYRW